MIQCHIFVHEKIMQVATGKQQTDKLHNEI